MKLIKMIFIFLCAILSFIAFNVIESDNATEIICELTKIWGPGLDPENIIMPARYFFIQGVSKNGSRVNRLPQKNTFNVNIFCEKQPCRVRIDVLNRRDGSLIVRYKLYETCSNLVISVSCLDEEILRSTYSKDMLYPEECSCNTFNNVENWLQKYGCTKYYEQIESDLQHFTVIDFDDIYPAAQEALFRYPNKHSICNYVIRDNQVYRQCHGQYVGFKMFMDAILLFITRRVHLPNLEFLVNLGDWPLIKEKVKIKEKEVLIPLLSWCGSDNTWDIVLPTYDITESSLENLGRVTLDMLSVQGNTGPTWENKIPKLFWRGRDSNRQRLELIKIGRHNPDLLNVSLTDFFFFKDLEETFGPKEPRISFFKFFDYKYQMNIDGTVAAYRFPYLLGGDSLIFKQDSPYYEFFYKELKRWKHFIPVKTDLSDLIDKLTWALTHDDEAQKIAKNGQEYAKKNLLPQDIFCYHVHLFRAYSMKQLNSNITVRDGMELVSKSSNKICDCSTSSYHHSEKINREEL